MRRDPYALSKELGVAMQRGEIVKSKAPRRWMAVLLLMLAAAGVALALFWSEQSKAAEEPDTSWSTADLRCEMVRIWPLPAECLFVFGGEERRR